MAVIKLTPTIDTSISDLDTDKYSAISDRGNSIQTKGSGNIVYVLDKDTLQFKTYNNNEYIINSDGSSEIYPSTNDTIIVDSMSCIQEDGQIVSSDGQSTVTIEEGSIYKLFIKSFSNTTDEFSKLNKFLLNTKCYIDLSPTVFSYDFSDITYFLNCTSLIGITISNVTISLKLSCFDGCTNLKYIYISSDSNLKFIYPSETDAINNCVYFEDDAGWYQYNLGDLNTSNEFIEKSFQIDRAFPRDAYWGYTYHVTVKENYAMSYLDNGDINVEYPGEKVEIGDGYIFFEEALLYKQDEESFS